MPSPSEKPFPQSKHAYEDLCAQFREGNVSKIYVALVAGIPERNDGTIRVPLGRMTGPRRKAGAGRGFLQKEAVTHYRVVKKYGRCALLDVRPETGRMHQIRAHLAWMRTPVVGDPEYGDERANSELRRAAGLTRQFLHCRKLTFTHPATRQTQSVSATLPPRPRGRARQNRRKGDVVPWRGKCVLYSDCVLVNSLGEKSYVPFSGSRKTVKAAMGGSGVLVCAVVVFSQAAFAETEGQADPKARVKTLIAQVGADKFEAREKATAELIGMGDAAAADVRKEFDSTQDPEVRMRLRAVLDKIALPDDFDKLDKESQEIALAKFEKLPPANVMQTDLRTFRKGSYGVLELGNIRVAAKNVEFAYSRLGGIWNWPRSEYGDNSWYHNSGNVQIMIYYSMATTTVSFASVRLTIVDGKLQAGSRKIPLGDAPAVVFYSEKGVPTQVIEWNSAEKMDSLRKKLIE